MNCFILLADIIGSSGKPPNKLMDHFKEMVYQINYEYDDRIVSPLTITLGDEFQGIVTSLPAAINIIFRFDQLLLDAPVDYQLRYLLNHGSVETDINRKNSYEMLGKGLTDARQFITEMKDNGERVNFLGFENNKKFNLSFMLYRSIYESWTYTEKAIVSAFLQYEDYKIVAQEFDRDSSSMWRKERSLNIKEYRAAMELISILANE